MSTQPHTRAECAFWAGYYGVQIHWEWSLLRMNYWKIHQEHRNSFSPTKNGTPIRRLSQSETFCPLLNWNKKKRKPYFPLLRYLNVSRNSSACVLCLEQGLETKRPWSCHEFTTLSQIFCFVLSLLPKSDLKRFYCMVHRCDWLWGHWDQDLCSLKKNKIK